MLYFMAIVLISTLLLHFKANIGDISVTIFRVVIFMSYVDKTSEILFCIALHREANYSMQGYKMVAHLRTKFPEKRCNTTL